MFNFSDLPPDHPQLPTRSRTGPQRPKIHADENAIVTKNTIAASARVGVKATAGPQRPALGEVTAAVNRQVSSVVIFQDRDPLSKYLKLRA